MLALHAHQCQEVARRPTSCPLHSAHGERRAPGSTLLLLSSGPGCSDPGQDELGPIQYLHFSEMTKRSDSMSHVRTTSSGWELHRGHTRRAPVSLGHFVPKDIDRGHRWSSSPKASFLQFREPQGSSEASLGGACSSRCPQHPPSQPEPAEAHSQEAPGDTHHRQHLSDLCSCKVMRRR